MVVSTGEFEFERSGWDITSTKDWHFPLPRIFWKPKVRSARDASLATRYTHKGSHRKPDPVRTAKTVAWRLFAMAVAVYHYAAVAFILKGAAAADTLLTVANFILAAAIGGVAVAVYFIRQANKPTLTAADIVYVTTEEARGGYGDGDTLEYSITA